MYINLGKDRWMVGNWERSSDNVKRDLTRVCVICNSTKASTKLLHVSELVMVRAGHVIIITVRLPLSKVVCFLLNVSHRLQYSSCDYVGCRKPLLRPSDFSLVTPSHFFRGDFYSLCHSFNSSMKLILLLMSALTSYYSFGVCTPQNESPAVVLSFPLEKRKFAIATDNVLRRRRLGGSQKSPVNRIDPEAPEVGYTAPVYDYSSTILVGTQKIVFVVDTESTDIMT